MRLTGILLLLALALAGGCATTANYERILNTWLGDTEEHLVDSWGVPQRVYKSGANKYLVYKRGGTVFIPGTSPTYHTTVIGNQAYTTAVGGSSPGFRQYWCETTFKVKDGRIINWTWEGNACAAYPPKE